MFTKPRKNQATMTQTDVYIPVDAIKGEQYFILCKSDLSPINQLLEKKENVYVLTEDEYKKLTTPAPIDSKEGAEEDDIYDSIYMKVVEIVEKDNIQGEMYNETANKLKEMFDIKYASPKQ